MNARPPVTHDAASGRTTPATAAAERVKISVAADGSPAITLADKEDRPRVRLTVTDEGFGALQFLNAKGDVIDTYAPERARGAK
jgi:hypothetical protein